MVSDELHRELQELYRIHDQMIAEARETEQAEQVHYKVSETPRGSKSARLMRHSWMAIVQARKKEPP